MTYKEDAKLFKALSDENRLQILCQLSRTEKCACVLQKPLDLTQSGLSYHMKILCDSGIVQGRKEGKWVHYSIDPAGAERARKLLNKQISLTDPVTENLCCRVEQK